MALDPGDPAADQSLFIEAVVPGEVHLDLIRAGVIEEPGHALNAWGRAGSTTACGGTGAPSTPPRPPAPCACGSASTSST
jgi:hypothetical protein